MPDHKRYDAAVVIKSHLKLLLFFLLLLLSRSLVEALLPTDEQGFIQLRSRYAAALALRTTTRRARVRPMRRRQRRRRRCSSSSSSSSSQPRHFEEAVAHTNGARYVGGAVCSERGRGLHQSYATVLEAAAATKAVVAAAAGACTTAKAAVQAKDSSGKARACRARTQSCRQ